MADRADLKQQGRGPDKRVRDRESRRANGLAFQPTADLQLRLGKLETGINRLARRFTHEQPVLVR